MSARAELAVFTFQLLGGTVYQASVKRLDGMTVAACRHKHKSFDAARKCGFKMRDKAIRAAGAPIETADKEEE